MEELLTIVVANGNQDVGKEMNMVFLVQMQRNQVWGYVMFMLLRTLRTCKKLYESRAK